MKADPRRVTEILNPCRRTFEAMTKEDQERFLTVVRLFAAERISPFEWLSTVRPAEANYRATLPAPEPPEYRSVKAKDGIATAGEARDN